MPYAPGVQYRGGDYIMAGIGQAAQGIAKGLEGIAERRREADYLDGAAEFYFQNDPEKYVKFREASVSKKRGLLTSAQAAHAEQLQQQQQQQREEAIRYQRERDAKLDARHAEEFNASQGWRADESALRWTGLAGEKKEWRPTPAEIEEGKAAGKVYRPQSPSNGYWDLGPGTAAGTKPAAPVTSVDTEGQHWRQLPNGEWKPYDPKVDPAQDVERKTSAAEDQELQRRIDVQRAETERNTKAGNRYPGIDFLAEKAGSKSYQGYLDELLAEQKRRQMGRSPILPETTVPQNKVVPTPAPKASPGEASLFRADHIYRDPETGERQRYKADGTWEPLSQSNPVKETPIGKVTSYGYAGDHYGGPAARASRIGPKGNQLDDNSLAVSPDIEEQLTRLGYQLGDTVTLQTAGGGTVTRRWDDRTAQYDSTGQWSVDDRGRRILGEGGKPLPALRGRFDFHAAGTKPSKYNGIQIVGIVPPDRLAKR